MFDASEDAALFPGEITIDSDFYAAASEAGQRRWVLAKFPVGGAPASLPVVQGLGSSFAVQIRDDELVLGRIAGTTISIR